MDILMQWHKEVNGLIAAVQTPAAGMANVLPLHLLVA